MPHGKKVREMFDTYASIRTSTDVLNDVRDILRSEMLISHAKAPTIKLDKASRKKLDKLIRPWLGDAGTATLPTSEDDPLSVPTARELNFVAKDETLKNLLILAAQLEAYTRSLSDSDAEFSADLRTRQRAAAKSQATFAKMNTTVEKLDKAITAIDTKNIKKIENHFQKIFRFVGNLEEDDKVTAKKLKEEKDSGVTVVQLIGYAVDVLFASVGVADTIYDCVQSGRRLHNFDIWLRDELVTHQTRVKELAQIENAERTLQFKHARDNKISKSPAYMKEIEEDLAKHKDNETPDIYTLTWYNTTLFPGEIDDQKPRTIMDFKTQLALRKQQISLQKDDPLKIYTDAELTAIEKALFDKPEKLEVSSQKDLGDYRDDLKAAMEKNEIAGVADLASTAGANLVVQLEKRHMHRLIQENEHDIISRLHVQAKEHKADKKGMHNVVDTLVGKKEHGKDSTFKNKLHHIIDNPDPKPHHHKRSEDIVDKKLKPTHKENKSKLKARSFTLVASTCILAGAVVAATCPLTSPFVIGALVALAVGAAAGFFIAEFIKPGSTKEIRQSVKHLPGKIREEFGLFKGRKKVEKEVKEQELDKQIRKEEEAITPHRPLSPRKS